MKRDKVISPDANVQLLNVRHAAAVLGMKPEAVRMAVRRGKLPSRSFGHRVVFVRDELVDFIRTLPRRTPTAKPGDE